MYYYAEIVRSELNHRGKPRLVSVLADFPDVLHYGFDADGPAPTRVEAKEGSRVRFWGFPEEIETPLPDGVTKLTKTVFGKGIADREAVKPVAVEIVRGPTLQERFDAASTDAERISVLAENAGLVA